MFYAKLTCLVEQYKWFEKDAFEKYAKDYPDGCHIRFNVINKLHDVVIKNLSKF